MRQEDSGIADTPLRAASYETAKSSDSGTQQNHEMHACLSTSDLHRVVLSCSATQRLAPFAGPCRASAFGEDVARSGLLE